ncbi:MAG: ligase-associated DNA damage response endonuclease PdeM [Hyphomicrobiaceae bacterium]
MLELKPERFDLRDYNDQRVSVSGRSMIADRCGALYWPSEDALIIADMHLEKGSHFARKGQMLPPYDTRATLLALAEAIDKYEAENIIALGDSFHDRDGPSRMQPEDREILAILQDDCDWYWVTGNHDPVLPPTIGGHIVNELVIGGLTLRHEPADGPVTHEIAGHMHPAAKISLYGHTLRRPCFIGNGRRMVLPAFGAYTGGLNVLDPAFEPVFGRDGFNVCMMGHEGLYPVATRLLRDD